MDPRAFKDVLGKEIPRMCEENPDIVYLDADLMSCIGTRKYSVAHPDRAINCGICEANMVGVAAGMASVGFKPIVHSFGTFASRRVFDQVFLSAGYAGNDITVIGSDPGVCAAFNGGTHMPFEDIALYRSLPNATIFDITDANMLISILDQCKDIPGVKYIRVGRKSAAKVFEDGEKIPLNKAITLREGKDAVVFASGILVHEAMQAAEALAKEGVDVAIVNVFQIKPIDEETIKKYAKATGRVVVAENHNKIGGLYSAVCETLARCKCAVVDYVAVEDEFGEVGPQNYLQERFGLTSKHIVEKVKGLL